MEFNKYITNKFFIFLFSIIITIAVSGCSIRNDLTSNNDVKLPSFILINANVYTMTKQSAEQESSNLMSLVIENGIITEVLSDFHIPPDYKRLPVFDMNGATILPGFIEPHAHLYLSTMTALLPSLMPCLPKKYQEVLNKEEGKPEQVMDCLLFIEDALSVVADKGSVGNFISAWRIGNGLDPSRMNFKQKCTLEGKSEGWPLYNCEENNSRLLLNRPAWVLAQEDSYSGNTKPISKPVFILDQSGHLGYVNEQAFYKTGICKNPETQRGEFNCTADDEEGMLEILGKIKDKYDFNDGDWGIECEDNKGCTFSGLLKEASAMQPFMACIAQKPRSEEVCNLSSESYQKVHSGSNLLANILEKIVEKLQIQAMKTQLKKAASHGLTTFVDGGADNTRIANMYQTLAMDDAPTRLRSVFVWNALDSEATQKEGKPVLVRSKLKEKNYPYATPNSWQGKYGMFGMAGIKLWSDGSTQGCSAALNSNYDANGLCAGFGKGHIDFSTDEIVTHLQDWWDLGWYMNVHANGDHALSNSINALRCLSAQEIKPGLVCNDNQLVDCTDIAPQNNQTGKLAHTIIHSTVNTVSDGAVSSMPATLALYENSRQSCLPNLSPSHLIAHVAYWGKSMENELGIDRVQYIDPAKTELDKDIPFSLHSDMSVSPLYPLWFVEQAVTRDTWLYPNLVEPVPRNRESNPYIHEQVSRYDAFKAITIVPAKQHRLDDKLGTIEKGKYADFVVLKSNPFSNKIADTAIHSIEILCTFINGNVKYLNETYKSEQITACSKP